MLAAEQGSGEAYYELGCLLEDGVVDTHGRVVIRPAYKQAVLAYQRAVELGYVSALLNLGFCYDRGFGVKKSKKHAMQCYRRVWEAEHSGSAASNIATVYRDLGDMARAFKWWHKAAKADDGGSFVNVGYCLYYGIGVRTNRRKAMAAFRRACGAKFITESEREEAHYHLAVAYLDRGKGRDKQRAGQLLRTANADDDYFEARRLLETLDEGYPKICRCRRWLWRSIPGQAKCRWHRTGKNARVRQNR